MRKECLENYNLISEKYNSVKLIDLIKLFNPNKSLKMVSLDRLILDYLSYTEGVTEQDLSVRFNTTVSNVKEILKILSNKKECYSERISKNIYVWKKSIPSRLKK
jgi:DNA-binding MarR family transcriptional regulator